MYVGMKAGIDLSREYQRKPRNSSMPVPGLPLSDHLLMAPLPTEPRTDPENLLYKMKVLVVYLGQASIPNFAHSMQSGVWGFKNNAQPEQAFSEGDLLFFASGYTGKNIRLPEDKWLPHSITLVATVVVTSQLSKIETSPHWPDETAANRILYPRRFTFANLRRQDGKFALDDTKLFPRELSLALRKAAIGGKAQVVEVPTLPEWLTDGTPTPKVPAQPTSPVRSAPTKPTPQRSIGDTLLEIESYVASRGFVFPNRISCLLRFITFQAIRNPCGKLGHWKIAARQAVR
jgi:hypothetical protein